MSKINHIAKGCCFVNHTESNCALLTKWIEVTPLELRLTVEAKL